MLYKFAANEPDLHSPHTLDTELNCWEAKWPAYEGDRPATIARTLQMCPQQMFPNVHHLLTIAATLPVTSCECERSFSRLRTIKKLPVVHNVRNNV